MVRHPQGPQAAPIARRWRRATPLGAAIRYRRVLALRRAGASLREIGACLGVSYQRASQLIRKAAHWERTQC